MIINTKKTVQSSINSEMVMLYWNVGRRIRTAILESEKAEYGKEIVSRLSRELKNEYGRGYSRRNLFNMIKLYDMYPDQEKVQTLSAQLTWSHLMLLMKYDDSTKIEFYVSMIANERWSVRILNERMNLMLYERTSLSKLPEETIRNDIEQLRNENKMSTEMFLIDPFVLDFLELRDTYIEKDLESSILQELEGFMLEFGRDFTFVGRQVRITIGDKDYYVDLLFYHRKLRRLVLIELKLGEFLPEHKGQVELYLRWLDKNERNEGEESPIRIILCAKKASETVELLELDKSGIHVAQYLTQMPPKDVLEHKLHLAIQRAKLKLEENKSK